MTTRRIHRFADELTRYASICACYQRTAVLVVAHSRLSSRRVAKAARAPSMFGEACPLPASDRFEPQVTAVQGRPSRSAGIALRPAADVVRACLDAPSSRGLPTGDKRACREELGGAFAHAVWL